LDSANRPEVAVAFRGWPPTAVEFYAGLEADNSKSYWLAHQDVYEQDVKAPMVELLDELAGEFGEGRMFRPYRDIRFSADKSPYKTSVAATVGSGYVHLSAEGLMVGAGMYHLEPDQLDRYRQAVADDASGEELEHIVRNLRGARIDVHGTDALKKAPQGYPADHPRVELLRYKGIVAMKAWPPAAWLGTAAAKKRVVDVLHSAGPLTDWLAQHVGPSAAARTRSR
jgi:uncharacterized protein (TIGR02453 family)